MRLDGIHHISCITGDAPTNLDFYTRVLGMRLVAKSVNQDDPYVYHLFYADHVGSPGSDLTFFEYPGALPGRAGAGMVYQIVFRVGSAAAIDFWVARLAAEGIATTRNEYCAATPNTWFKLSAESFLKASSPPAARILAVSKICPIRGNTK